MCHANVCFCLHRVSDVRQICKYMDHRYGSTQSHPTKCPRVWRINPINEMLILLLKVVTINQCIFKEIWQTYSPFKSWLIYINYYIYLFVMRCLSLKRSANIPTSMDIPSGARILFMVFSYAAYASSEADETASVLLADVIGLLVRMHFLSACYQENNKLTPVVRLKIDTISNMIAMIVNMKGTISKPPSSQTSTSIYSLHTNGYS